MAPARPRPPAELGLPGAQVAASAPGGGRGRVRLRSRRLPANDPPETRKKLRGGGSRATSAAPLLSTTRAPLRWPPRRPSSAVALSSLGPGSGNLPAPLCKAPGPALLGAEPQGPAAPWVRVGAAPQDAPLQPRAALLAKPGRRAGWVWAKGEEGGDAAGAEARWREEETATSPEPRRRGWEGERGPFPAAGPDLQPAPLPRPPLRGFSRLSASPPLGPESTHPYPARPLWLQLALVSNDPTRFGFDSRIAPTAGYLRGLREELMDASKQLRERKTWRELTTGDSSLPAPFPKLLLLCFSRIRFYSLQREGEEIIYLEAVLALTVRTKYSKSKALDSTNEADYNQRSRVRNRNIQIYS